MQTNSPLILTIGSICQGLDTVLMHILSVEISQNKVRLVGFDGEDTTAVNSLESDEALVLVLTDSSLDLEAIALDSSSVPR